MKKVKSFNIGEYVEYGSGRNYRGIIIEATNRGYRIYWFCYGNQSIVTSWHDKEPFENFMSQNKEPWWE